MDSLSNILSDQKSTYLSSMNVSSLDDAFLAFDIVPPVTVSTEIVIKEDLDTNHSSVPSSGSNINGTKVSENKLSELMQVLLGLKRQVDAAIKLLDVEKISVIQPPVSSISFDIPTSLSIGIKKLENSTQILEGLFNGEKMIGEDSKEYAVPPNYASKSKLVEGDFMKLTITPSGSFIYKQVGPVPRERLMGSLARDPLTTSWLAETPIRTYKILTASVTFYRGKPGDKVVFLVPKNGECVWGAVDNIISE